MSIYAKFKDYTGIIVNIEEETLKLACCDCGFVHYYGLTIKDDKHIMVGFKKDDRATAQLRRHNFGNLQQRRISKYKLVKVDQILSLFPEPKVLSAEELIHLNDKWEEEYEDVEMTDAEWELKRWQLICQAQLKAVGVGG